MSDTPGTLIKLGYEARRTGSLVDANLLLAKAVEVSRGARNQALLARSLTALGQIERDLNNNLQALQHYKEAASIYRSLPDPLSFAHTIRHVGDILRNEGSEDQATPFYEEALTIYRAHNETSDLDLANAIRGLALIGEDARETETLWLEARELYTAANGPACRSVRLRSSG
jgi:tetratricopeptide (TPR) repeat protein